MLKMTTLLSGSLSALFLAWYFFSNLQEPAQKTVLTPIFSAAYPVHPRFLREISQMRSSLTLNSENENLIHVSAHNAEAHLGIPQSLLWCLMFQESRLNHLSGLASGKLSTGLGQFSNSAFFEVNHHLKLYFDSPRTVLNALMGLDIRPLQSNPEEVSAINSYYFIPTGVTATALYLSNRWIQLTRVAQKRNLTYSPDILWAWSAISYNKGTRSVLAIWNQIEAKEGIPGLTQALTRRESFVKHTANLELITKSLRSIWPNTLLPDYSQELLTHVENIRECAFLPQQILEKERSPHELFPS